MQSPSGPKVYPKSQSRRRRRRRRRCLLPSGNWRGKNNALSGYDGADQPWTSRERTPAAKSCPTVYILAIVEPQYAMMMTWWCVVLLK